MRYNKSFSFLVGFLTYLPACLEREKTELIKEQTIER
jgi:hypothetical protein